MIVEWRRLFVERRLRRTGRVVFWRMMMRMSLGRFVRLAILEIILEEFWV